MVEGDRPALYHLAVDVQVAESYRDAMRLANEDGGMEFQVQDTIDLVFDLDTDEVMMKLRAIECHRSQLQEWRIVLRDHPELLQRGYGHEPYMKMVSLANGLTPTGLLGEFA
jgi:hypothetical protein